MKAVAEALSFACDGVQRLRVGVVLQGGGEGLQGARDGSREVVGEGLNPAWVVGLVDHLLDSSFRAVQRHAQLLDVVLSDTAQESAGDLGLDGCPAPPHPVQAPAQGFGRTTGRIAVARCGKRVHNFRDRVSRAPAEGIHGPLEGTHRVVGQDHVFRDGQPRVADGRGQDEPSDPIAGEVPGTGEKSGECADHSESAGAGTPGPQRVRQEHLQDQECRSGPHRGLAEFDGHDDRHGRDHCRPAERANAVAAVGIGDQQCSEEACSGAEQRYRQRFGDTEHEGHRNQRGPRKYCRARGSSTTTSPNETRVDHFQPRSNAGHHGSRRGRGGGGVGGGEKGGGGGGGWRVWGSARVRGGGRWGGCGAVSTGRECPCTAPTLR